MELSNARIVQNGNSYHAVHGDDKGLYVVFTDEAIEDTEASAKEGRPIYKIIPHVNIHIVGDKTRNIVRPVKMVSDGSSPADPERFPSQWTIYKNKSTVPHDGTPITEWPPISKSVALELKGLNIHTVEALANVSDVNLTWMGARTLQAQAKAYLEKAKDNSDITQMQSENEQLRTDMDVLRKQIQALTDMKEEKPRRGRPPKEVNDAEDAT